MKPLLSQLRRQPSLAEVGLILVLMLLLWEPCKLAVVICSVVAAAVALSAAFAGRRWLNLAYHWMLLVWLMSVALPFDLHVARGDQVSVRILRVIVTHGKASQVRDDAMRRGVIENRDYVIYNCEPWP